MDVLAESKRLYCREGTVDDTTNLYAKMRDMDVKECLATGQQPLEALRYALSNDDITLSVISKTSEEPIAMFGSGWYFDNKGWVPYVWLLGSEEIWTHRKDFVSHSKHFLDLITDDMDFAMNVVHVDNKPSIRWLKWLGCEFLPEVVISGEPFHPFIFLNKKKYNV